MDSTLVNKDYRSEAFTKFVALGESTTAGGWSTSRERCWVSRLADMVSDFQDEPVQVFNAGIGANVISTRSVCYAGSGKPAADERLDRHVIAEKPDLLVISYGLNDCRGGTPLSVFCDEMRSLVQRVQAALEPVIILPGPYYMTDFTVGGAAGFGHGSIEGLEEFNRGIERVAKETGSLYVDLLDACGGAEWMIHYDGVHANDLGHRVIANRIFEVLARNCSALSARTKRAERTSPRWRDESSLTLGFPSR